jgi:hypothetical protein
MNECLALLVMALACAGQAQATPQIVTLSCAVAYLPARSTWVREVQLGWDGDTLTSVRIDGLTPHSFSLDGASVATAIDNERIQIDLRQLRWSSDFRGLASGQGRCDAEGV